MGNWAARDVVGLREIQNQIRVGSEQFVLAQNFSTHLRQAVTALS